MKVANVTGAGPTVEEPMDTDEYHFDEFDIPSEPGMWTADDELNAKTKHLREAIDGNDSYEVVPSDTKGGLRLTTTWVVAIRDGLLKARLCARDFAKTKRTDLFAPGSTALTNRVIDFKAVKLNLDTYTVDVVAAYNTIDEPELVIVTPPPEWYAERNVAGLSTDVLWRMKKLLPGRRIAAKLWVERVGDVHRQLGFKQCVGFRQFFYHEEKQLTSEVHMDDIHGCGPSGAIDDHLLELKELLVLKRAIRHEEGAVYQHLKRFRHVYSERRLIRPNPAYVQEVVGRLGWRTQSQPAHHCQSFCAQ
jgi:hypothetical protein